MYEINITLFALLACLLVGLNPLVFSIVLALITAGHGNRYKTRLLWLLSGAFVSAFVFSIFATGISTIFVLERLNTDLQAFIAMLAAGLAIATGVIELAGFFIGKSTLTIPPSLVRALHRHSTKRVSKTNALTLGILASAASLFVVGSSLFALANIAALLDTATPLSIASAAVVLAIPVSGLAIAAIHTQRLSVLSAWRDESASTLRAVVGMTGIVLGWMILLMQSGVITI